MLAGAGASLALVASLAAPAYGGFIDDDSDAADWQASLYGSWRLVSIDAAQGPVVRCPGRWTSPEGFVVRCGRADKLTINADHSYRDSLSVTRGNSGIWAAWVGIIAFDDRDAEADPQAYRFRLKARELIIYVDLEVPGVGEGPSHRATMKFARVN